MELAEFIDMEIEPILAEWDAFAATRLTAGEKLPVKDLRNDARELLLHIAADMRTAQSAADRSGKGRGLRPDNAPNVNEYSRRHAEHRLAIGFTLNQMVSEYRALRASVMRLWTPSLATGDPTAVSELIRFGEAMDQMTAESIAWYSAKLEESRIMLLGVLGHDLRSPLGAARTSAIYMLRTERLDSELTQAANRILNSTTRMGQMVHDLLDFTGTRMGTALPINRLPGDLNAVCQEVIDELSAFHPGRVLQLKVGPEKLEGHWDLLRVNQMLTNLVANAILHGRREAPVTMTARDVAGAVEVAVHNQGPPIAERELPHLFEPLVRRIVKPGVRREGSSGLGLGLYIARQIALAHGGRIEVRSDAADGTTFTVKLPRPSV